MFKRLARAYVADQMDKRRMARRRKMPLPDGCYVNLLAELEIQIRTLNIAVGLCFCGDIDTRPEIMEL